jgi:GntR family transcriptional regulator/MocR family aminotransferase
VLGQLALADFIARGELDRHIRRTRLRYERRREALLVALRRWLPQARPSRAGAGLFELVRLPAQTNEPALVRAAAERGVGVEGLALHRYAAREEPALLLGYAAMAEPAIEQGVRLLADAYEQARR